MEGWMDGWMEGYQIRKECGKGGYLGKKDGRKEGFHGQKVGRYTIEEGERMEGRVEGYQGREDRNEARMEGR